MKRRVLAFILLLVLLVNTVAMSSCGFFFEPAVPESGRDGVDGADGKDGKDGIDGVTPLLRINEETEFWEVSYDNGKTWTSMGVKASGEDGKDGQNGSDGKDGVDGEDGKDGVTPKLQINPETSEWEVSYDNGKTWTGLGYFAEAKKDTGFEGLKISILGDSISTYSNASNGTAANITNSTIKNGAIYYNPGTLGVYQGDTWWQQTADALGGSILVNNSWSGSCVFSTRAGTVGAYVDRCVQLHDDTGMNAGEEPDLIFAYLGTNDCSVWSSYPLGDYEAIDFNSLIQKSERGYIYAEPKTASEAYAIMIHKMMKRYTDAEIYCMIPCQRIDGNATAVANRLVFYDAIEKIANRFGAYTIDLYNDSGITTESESFTTFIPDNSLHPGQAGMDAITNTILSALYENSMYAPVDKEVFSVSYETDAVILEGRKYATLGDEPFSCTVKEKDGYELNISVFMNGEEITDTVCYGNKVLVEKVTGNITIEADYTKIVRAPLNFRFETVNDKLVSVTTDGNTENTVTQNQGTIVDGLYTNAQFSLGTTIELLHNRAWAIEWKIQGRPNILLLSSKNQSALNKNGDYYLFFSNSGFVALGEYTGAQFDNYVSAFSTDLYSKMTVYRLENRISDDGTNMVYLFIDGEEIGPLNDYRINGGAQQNITSNWVSGKDFYFSNVGTTSSHTINNCYLKYLQVWEEIE